MALDARRGVPPRLHRVPRFKDPLLGVVVGGDTSDVAREIAAQATASDAIPAVLSLPEILRALDAEAMNGPGVEEPRTVTALVDDLYAGRTASPRAAEGASPLVERE